MKTSTSKSDARNHGIGLSSVLYAVEKDNGKIVLSQEGGFVLADAIIPIGEAKKVI